MEISNKAFGIFCVVVFGVVLVVRAQNANTTPKVVIEPASMEVAVEKPRHRNPIPNSTLPPDVNINTSSDDVPLMVEGGLPQSLPASTPASAPPVATAAPQVPTVGTGTDDLTYQDDLSGLTAPAQTNPQQELSDRDVLRIMLGTLNDQQQNEFRTVWFTMSPDERQQLIDEVRGSQQGG